MKHFCLYSSQSPVAWPQRALINDHSHFYVNLNNFDDTFMLSYRNWMNIHGNLVRQRQDKKKTKRNVCDIKSYLQTAKEVKEILNELTFDFDKESKQNIRAIYYNVSTSCSGESLTLTTRRFHHFSTKINLQRYFLLCSLYKSFWNLKLYAMQFKFNFG